MLDQSTFSGGNYLPLQLAGALCMACAYLVVRPRRRKTRLRTALRIVFTPRVWLHKSALLDYQYVIAGAFVFPLGFAYVTLTSGMIGEAVYALLDKVFGVPAMTHGGVGVGIIAGLALYLAYEFAYWLDHYLCHKLPFLWEFHKVHHSAEVLTPFTNWRVHPVDTAVFVNIVAVMMGAVQGVIYYRMGKEAWLFSLTATNILILFYMTVYGHLQHSQLWITFNGVAGRVFMSPAHHQIHHSTEPIHYDRNFGAGLSLFDWLFGTHFQPPTQNPKLRFGAGNSPHLKGLIPSLCYPFIHSWRHIYQFSIKNHTKTDG